MSTIVKNTLILTMDREDPVKRGDIVITDGRFAQVGGSAEEREGDTVIDGSHHVAMPGFANAHATAP